MKKKVLGVSPIDGRDVVNFNIRLLVGYRTDKNEKVKTEAIISVQTTDKQTAEDLAVEKVKRQLEVFPYIVKESVTIELKRRKKKGEA